MKRMMLIAAVAAASLTVGVSTTLAERGQGGGCPMGKGGPMARLAKIVPDLTEQQQTQLEQIMEGQRKQGFKHRLKMRKLHRELRDLAIAGAEKKATDAKIDEIVSLKASVMKQRFAKLREARKVLTEEQLEVLEEYGIPLLGHGKPGGGCKKGPCGGGQGGGCGKGMRPGPKHGG